jgi:hypothetical protein
VGVSVGVAVGVTVGVSVGVAVGVAVGVTVGVSVGVAVGVTVGVSVGVGVGVFVGVSVGVGVTVGLFVGVGVGVFVGVFVGVGHTLGLRCFALPLEAGGRLTQPTTSDVSAATATVPARVAPDTCNSTSNIAVATAIATVSAGRIPCASFCALRERNFMAPRENVNSWTPVWPPTSTRIQPELNRRGTVRRVSSKRTCHHLFPYGSSNTAVLVGVQPGTRSWKQESRQ